jgi:hypothetical protein
MLPPYCDRADRIVAARVSESSSPEATVVYPPDKQYYARADETPQRIAKMFGANLEVKETFFYSPSCPTRGNQEVRDCICICSLLTCHYLMQQKLLEINKATWPEMTYNSKLKAHTLIQLPPLPIKWMLARVLEKSKVEKKKKYKVQDIEAPLDSANGIFNDVESKRIQDYPQLNNVYEQGEVVCALWPEGMSPTRSSSSCGARELT